MQTMCKWVRERKEQTSREESDQSTNHTTGKIRATAGNTTQVTRQCENFFVVTFKKDRKGSNLICMLNFFMKLALPFLFHSNFLFLFFFLIYLFFDLDLSFPWSWHLCWFLSDLISNYSSYTL